MVLGSWERICRLQVGRIYECQGHLLYFFQKYEKPVLPFITVWYFLIKVFPRAVQKLGTVPVLVFTFHEEPQAKKNHILYDWANLQRAFETTLMIIKNRQN